MRLLAAMRFVAERSPHGDWVCVAEGVPCLACGGPAPDVAFRRACHAYAVDPAGYGAVERAADRVVFDAIRTPPAGVCPDCGGTGTYVGLNAVEPCRRCADGRRDGGRCWGGEP